jgi:predicted phage tail protein
LAVLVERDGGKHLLKERNLTRRSLTASAAFKTPASRVFLCQLVYGETVVGSVVISAGIDVDTI